MVHTHTCSVHWDSLLHSLLRSSPSQGRGDRLAIHSRTFFLALRCLIPTGLKMKLSWWMFRLRASEGKRPSHGMVCMAWEVCVTMTRTSAWHGERDQRSKIYWLAQRKSSDGFLSDAFVLQPGVDEIVWLIDRENPDTQNCLSLLGRPSGLTSWEVGCVFLSSVQCPDGMPLATWKFLEGEDLRSQRSSSHGTKWQVRAEWKANKHRHNEFSRIFHSARFHEGKADTHFPSLGSCTGRNTAARNHNAGNEHAKERKKAIQASCYCMLTLVVAKPIKM